MTSKYAAPDAYSHGTLDVSLRQAVRRLAVEHPETREHLLPLLRHGSTGDPIGIVIDSRSGGPTFSETPTTMVSERGFFMDKRSKVTVAILRVVKEYRRDIERMTNLHTALSFVRGKVHEMTGLSIQKQHTWTSMD